MQRHMQCNAEFKIMVRYELPSPHQRIHLRIQTKIFMNFFFLRFPWKFHQESFWGREKRWWSPFFKILTPWGSKWGSKGQKSPLLRVKIVKNLGSSISLKFGPGKLLMSRKTVVKSGFQNFDPPGGQTAVKRLKFTPLEGKNRKNRLLDFPEIWTRKAFVVEKKDGEVLFFKIFTPLKSKWGPKAKITLFRVKIIKN